MEALSAFLCDLFDRGHESRRIWVRVAQPKLSRNQSADQSAEGVDKQHLDGDKRNERLVRTPDVSIRAAFLVFPEPIPPVPA